MAMVNIAKKGVVQSQASQDLRSAVDSAEKPLLVEL
jgi:hypothetical protein